MKLAWRGVVMEDGQIVAWPMMLMTHSTAFQMWPHLRKYRARWRQWVPGDAVDFDPGTSAHDQGAVSVWIDAVNAISDADQ